MKQYILTEKQRKEIYAKAADTSYFQKEYNNVFQSSGFHSLIGACVRICLLVEPGKITNLNCDEITAENFPELYLFNDVGDQVYFLNDTKSRMSDNEHQNELRETILLFCAEMCDDKN